MVSGTGGPGVSVGDATVGTSAPGRVAIGVAVGAWPAGSRVTNKRQTNTPRTMTVEIPIRPTIVGKFRYFEVRGGGTAINYLSKKEGHTPYGHAPRSSQAGEQGLEPRPADPESAVLPLDDSPGLDNIVASSNWKGKFMSERA